LKSGLKTWARQVRKIVPRAPRVEQFFAVWAAQGAAQTAKLSQRRTSKKQKVLQRSNPFVSETFVSFGLLVGAPALETDFKQVISRSYATNSGRSQFSFNLQQAAKVFLGSVERVIMGTHPLQVFNIFITMEGVFALRTCLKS
jgi:hypothetical protein